MIRNTCSVPSSICRRLGALGTVAVSLAVSAGAISLAPEARSQSAPSASTTLAPATNSPDRKSIFMPVPDSANGRRLFVTKGCVVCHSINGAGGRAGPALDAAAPSSVINVLEFVVRMWRGAPIMFQLQEMELGYRVRFTGPELADLAGFVGDAAAQRGFSINEVPEVMREWIVDEADWKGELKDWREKMPDEFPMLDSTEEGR